MGLFSKKPVAALPPQFAAGLEAYGDHVLANRSGAGFNTDRFGDLLTILDAAQRDPKGFVQQLEAAIQSRPGSAAVGAVTQMDALSLPFDTPPAQRLLDRSLDALREYGVRWSQLKPYQQQRWLATRSRENW
jgi:hypothetical protein